MSVCKCWANVRPTMRISNRIHYATFSFEFIRKMKELCWERQIFGTLLTDFSKAFICLYHELITAKLNAYGFSLPALRLIRDYLSNRKQRTKIDMDHNYGSRSEILFGVPHGSILGPLVFNIFWRISILW